MQERQDGFFQFFAALMDHDKPVGIFLTHGGGGKAIESLKSICRSFKLRLACAPVTVLNRPDEAATQKLREMGTLLGKLAVAE